MQSFDSRDSRALESKAEVEGVMIGTGAGRGSGQHYNALVAEESALVSRK